MRFTLIALLFLAVAPSYALAQQVAPVFDMPIACDVASTCAVQNYADADAHAGVAEDPNCGPFTYDGHDGLDLRAPAAMARRGVNVIAPADGVIVALRDGEPDGAFLSGGQAALNGRDCGNGVRIDHGNGWESQLCHMRSGSFVVRTGDHVMKGARIGLVGLSGHTEFPHVHITLRHNGEKVDPLTGQALGAVACGAITPGALWSPAARSALSYRGARVFAWGFTGDAPGPNPKVEDFADNAGPNAPAMVFWALAIGPKSGDVINVRLRGPDGSILGQNTRTQPRDQAQASLFVGKRTPPGGWPTGVYTGDVEILRNGLRISSHTQAIRISNPH